MFKVSNVECVLSYSHVQLRLAEYSKKKKNSVLKILGKCRPTPPGLNKCFVLGEKLGLTLNKGRRRWVRSKYNKR